jgi:hypothetical protein
MKETERGEKDGRRGIEKMRRMEASQEGGGGGESERRRERGGKREKDRVDM